MGVENSGSFTLGTRKVWRLGFGAMRVCGPGVWGHPRDPAEARAVLRRVPELGITLIDTADSYGPEISEYLLAETLHPYEGLVVATKGGLVRPGPRSWQRDGRPAHLRVAIANSLRRLEVDRITLYQLHAVDDDVPLADSLAVLAEAQRAGQIEHIGLSNVSVAQIERARTLVDVVTVQNRYNLLDREHAPVLRYCEAHGIGFIPWYPLAAGELAKPGGVVHQIAARHGASPSQVALAWLLGHSPVMLPIPGTSSVAHLEQNCAAADLVLDEADRAALDAAV